MKKKISSWKDCRRSEVVAHYAERNGCEVTRAKGSHFKIKKGTDTMTAYEGDISIGVAVKIFKFFVKLGIVCLVLAYFGTIFI